jgi:hypothetical protein
MTPGSLTTSARRAPISDANSPRASIFPGPKTIRVRGWKSNGDITDLRCGGGLMSGGIRQ